MLESNDFLFVLTRLHDKREPISLKNVQLCAQKHVLLLKKKLRVNVKEYRNQLIVHSEFEHLMMQCSNCILDIRLEHNHQMVLPEQQNFLRTLKHKFFYLNDRVFTFLKFGLFSQQNSLTV